MNSSSWKKAKLATVFTVLLLGGVAVWFTLADTGYSKINTKESGVMVSTASANDTPGYFYFTKNPKHKPSISAEAYVVGDISTGEIILSKDKDEVFPIASVSKMMTALVAHESGQEDGTADISKSALATEGGNGGFHLGEKIKVADLLYPLLLESSNDAAEAIAEFFDRNTFLENMNRKSKELGMSSTSFQDPSGLSPGNKSTALDLFRLSQYVHDKRPELLDLTLNRSMKHDKHVWFNNSQFLGLDGYRGGKRGYIDEARQTAMSVFSIPLSGEEGESRDIGITLLRSPDRLRDTENLLSYIKNNIYFGLERDADMEWYKQKEGVLEEKEPNYLKLVFGGDIMLDRGVRSSVMKNFAGDYSALFEKLPILGKAEIAFANLEGTASDKGKDLGNLYSFRMDPSVIPALKGAGFDVLSLANNHIGDWGREAYTDTLSRFEENEIFYTGGGYKKEEAKKPVIIEKYRMKVGFLGFSDVGPNYMQATDTASGQLLASDPNFEQIIKDASAQVDFLITSFHWGDEYKTKHNTRQEYLAHKAIDAGAKIVIGHHPHVVEDTEVYNNGFIAYSLGNFIFDQRFSEATMEGMLLEMTLGRDGSMSVKKNIVKINSVFQLDKLIEGKDEKLDIEEVPILR